MTVAAATSLAAETNQRPSREVRSSTLLLRTGLHSVRGHDTEPRKTCSRVRGICNSAIMKREFVQPCAGQNSEFTHPLEAWGTKKRYLSKLSSLDLQPVCPSSRWKKTCTYNQETKNQNRPLRTYCTYPPDARLERGWAGRIRKRSQSQNFPCM